MAPPVTIDKSDANLAGLHAINAQRERHIRIRQAKCLSNIVEQDHQAIKLRTRPMLCFKVFRCARILLGSIEVMHLIVKGQMKYARGTNSSAARPVLLVGDISSPHHINPARFSRLMTTKPLRIHIALHATA